MSESDYQGGGSQQKLTRLQMLKQSFTIKKKSSSISTAAADGSTLATSGILSSIASPTSADQYSSNNSSSSNDLLRSAQDLLGGIRSTENVEKNGIAHFELQYANLLVWRLQVLYVSNRFDECLSVCDKILEKTYGWNENALYMKGLILRKQQRNEEALKYFFKAKSMNKANILTLKQIGKCYASQGKHQAAIETYNETLKYAGSDWSLHHSSGLSYLALKKYDEALECFQTAINIQENEKTYLCLSRLYIGVGDLDSAIQVNMTAVQKYPDNPKFLSTLGKLQSQVTGSMGNAIEILEKATNLADAEEDAFLALSSIMGQKSQYNETLFRLKRAMDMYPNSPLVWNNVGSCYLGQGKYHKAYSCFQHAFDLSPTLNWKICHNYGLACMALERYLSAHLYLESAHMLQLEKSGGKIVCPDTILYKAIALYQLGDLLEANTHFQALMGIDGNSIVYILNYLIFLNNTTSLANQFNSDFNHAQQREILNSTIQALTESKSPADLLDLLGKQGSASLKEILA